MDTDRLKLGTRAKYLDKIDENYAKTFGRYMLSKKDTGIRKQFIKDIPVLYTIDGTVVCIPKLQEMGSVGVVGRTGSGKTLFSGQFIDGVFWLWHDCVADMNDSQAETITWSESNDVLEFKLRLRKINQKPMPLPVVYIFPNFDKLKVNKEILKDKNYIVVSIPFEEIINNIESYIPGLAGSLKYIVEKKKELLEVQNERDLYDIIDSIQIGKATETVQSKLKACFNQLISEGILNISDSSAPSIIQVYDTQTKKTIYTGNPMTAVMKAECVPSFITSDLYTEKYKDAIFAYWINALWEESLKGTMKGKRVWIYFDELSSVVDISPENKCPSTKEKLNTIASRGRNNSISLFYATQNYHLIPSIIRSQTTFGITFYQKDPKSVDEFCKDFQLDRKWKDKIKSLKKYECVCATPTHFICYKGDKKWESPGPFYGTSFPALHKNKFLNRKT